MPPPIVCFSGTVSGNSASFRVHGGVLWLHLATVRASNWRIWCSRKSGRIRGTNVCGGEHSAGSRECGPQYLELAFGKSVTASAMQFKQELLTALQTGATHGTLLDIPREHRSELVEPHTAYEVLEQIWLELGFDDSDVESPLRNELEVALETTWYGSPLTNRTQT
jgi:hypothetical protein